MKCSRIVTITALLLVLMPKAVRAQYDMVFSHYFDMQTSFNPAAAGKDPKLNVNVAYSMQLVGYEHNPQTAYFAGDMPFRSGKSKHGLGLMLMNDNIGLFSHQRLTAQYAYHKNIKKGYIAAGIQAGLLSEKFKGSGLDLEESGDEVFSTSDLDGNALDIGVGIYAKFPNWYIGLSAQHLTYPTVSLGDYNELSVDGSYYLTGGYDFQLPNPTLKVATSALIRSDLVGYRADITGRVIYSHEERYMYAGVGYSPTNSVTFYVGLQVQGIDIGYSYEAYTNAIGFEHGSHEIRLGYKTDVDLGKKGKNYHQAVRYL